MTRAFVFPGQGSQTVGMGSALCDAFPIAREVLEEVDDALGQSLTRLMREGPIEELTLTANAQPALMAVSVATSRVLEQQSGKGIADLARYVAGHSLGEYSALAAAHSIGISDAAKLLRKRGDAMQSAVPVGEGAMAAILGLDLEIVEAIADSASAGSEDVCAAANDNAPGQVVLSGSAACIDRAIDLAKEKGAKRAMRLDVSAPFHCSLMAPAADVMEDALAHTIIHAPAVPLIANVTAARTIDPETIRRQLVQQVCGRVRWRECVLTMASEEIETLVEIGNGKVLSGLARRIDKTLTGMSLNTPEDIDAFLSGL